jgi:hypothetical protein
MAGQGELFGWTQMPLGFLENGADLGSGCLSVAKMS